MKTADIAVVMTTMASLGSVVFSLALGPAGSASLGVGYVMVLTAFANGAVITCGQLFGKKGAKDGFSGGAVYFDSRSVGVIAAEKSSSGAVVSASYPA